MTPSKSKGLLDFCDSAPPPTASMLYIHTRKSRRTPQGNILSEFSVFSLELGKIDQTITYSPRSFTIKFLTPYFTVMNFIVPTVFHVQK